jgi:hypothetical protein
MLGQMPPAALIRALDVFLLGENMIDREARKQAAEIIRHYVCGIISNKEFERRYPISKVDPIIHALDDSLWATHEDIFTHKLVGKNAVSKKMKERVARWLMFLYSDNAYQWPQISDSGFRDLHADSWLGNLIHDLFGFGEKSSELIAHGDYDVWPFLRRENFEDALKKPFLLKGNI